MLAIEAGGMKADAVVMHMAVAARDDIVENFMVER